MSTAQTSKVSGVGRVLWRLEPSLKPHMTYLFRAHQLVRFRFCIQGSNCRWIEPFSNEPDAQRKLKERDRDRGDRRLRRPDEAEHHSEVACEEYGCSDDSDQGKASRHQTRLVQQEAQQQVAYGRHE